MIDKTDLLELLRGRVRERLDALLASQKSAQSGATHEDNRAEHSKDMRSTEASYLARGLAARVETLVDMASQLAAFRVFSIAGDGPVALGALVTVEGDEDESQYFVVPAAGGESFAIEGETVQTITPASPLGAALIGQRLDDEVELALPGGRSFVVVTSVR